MEREQLDTWLSPQQQTSIVTLMMQRVGITRIRADYFVRLWVYLLVKQLQEQQPHLKPPLAKLELPQGHIVCTHREAAELFYGDQARGSDRAAGMMLDKFVSLNLIKKYFDGNTTRIEILAAPEVLGTPSAPSLVQLHVDAFMPRCDAIPIAHLLATNYTWMNRNTQGVPHRIAKLLRGWAQQYNKGMRVLRRCDNQNPVGFGLLYPTSPDSEVNFFGPPRNNLYLCSEADVDPFVMAQPGDRTCTAVFIRSWIIDSPFLADHRADFIADLQQVLVQMQVDFPNLCDLYTFIIHPSYEQMAEALGFQTINRDTHLSICCMYQALDRFLALDIPAILEQ